MKTYFYVSTTGDGWKNLAMDEFLLESIGGDDMVLYLYTNENAVIIGRNQNPWMECSLNAMDADNVQLVRRISGGGAVYHDLGNLNFSFIAHKSRYDTAAQTALIGKTLAWFGIECEISGRNDLTAGGRKFSGSAYCTRGENSQHHGTLMVNADVEKMSRYLTVSPEKLKAKGVSSVRSRVCNLGELCPELTCGALAKALRDELEKAVGKIEPLTFTPGDMVKIEALGQKHASWQWRMGAAPAFDYCAEKRFDWGMVQLCLTVDGGLIQQARLFTDSLDTALPGSVEPRLEGALFSTSTMAEALTGCGVDDIARWVKTMEL